jgi:hypothetical protein
MFLEFTSSDWRRPESTSDTIANYRAERRTRHLPKTILQHIGCSKGRNGSVGKRTRYRLDGLGVESWWGEILHTNPGRSQGPYNLLYNGYRDFSPGVKRPIRGVEQPPPSRAEVKERIYIYIYISILPVCALMAYSRVGF